MSKKLIRITQASWQQDLYVSYPKALVFAFVGSDTQKDEKGVLSKIQLTKFVGCRELLCSDFRSSLFKCKKGTTSQVHKDYPVDTETLRLLIVVNNSKNQKASNEEIKTRIFAAKRVINMLEELGNFSTSSVITSVKPYNEAYDGTSWLLTGAKEWQSAPQMLSLLTLIFRVSYFIEGGLVSDSPEKFIKQLGDLPYIGGSDPKYNESAINDFSTLRGVKNYLLKIIKLHDKLFYDTQEKSYFKDENTFVNNGYGGISALMACGTGDNALNKKFKNLILSK